MPTPFLPAALRRTALPLRPFAALGLAAALASAGASAQPVQYTIDPHHTFPSFEADHMGISVWRGKMNRSSGSVMFDKASGQGEVDVSINLDSIDFGQDKLNAWARGKEFFDTKKYPKARFQGRFDAVKDGTPTQLVGTLTLHGASRPMTLQITHMKCVPHPIVKRELCGADANGTFQRDEFGLDAGKDWGFKMNVDLRIQVEALAAQ